MVLPVPGLETRYLISDTGDIWSTYRQKSTGECMLMHTYKSKRGHYRVPLWTGKKYVNYTVSRLVLLTFAGPAPGKEANHINGIKSDNRLSNLEWVTGDENQAHAVKFGLKRRSKFIGPRMANHQFFSRRALYEQYGC